MFSRCPPASIQYSIFTPICDDTLKIYFIPYASGSILRLFYSVTLVSLFIRQCHTVLIIEVL